MGREVHDQCGYCLAHTLHDCLNFTKRLQHRGRDAFGIVAMGFNRIDAGKWLGQARNVDIFDLHKIFPSSDYHTYFGHVRYTTQGKKNEQLETLLNEAHPQVIGGKYEYRDSHLIIRNCDAAMVHNGQVDRKHFTGLDQTLLKTTCDTEALLHFFYRHGERGLLNEIPGAYSLAIADKRHKNAIVLRDRHGMRPGVLGLKGGKFCVSSEDSALLEEGGHYFEDLMPGRVYYLHPQGSYHAEQVVNPVPQNCFFEWNYNADTHSILSDISVRVLRARLGAALAQEFRPEGVDVVTFLPRCPELAAIRYAREAGLPFLPVFYKLDDERAFQGPTKEERKASIKKNLYLLDGVVEALRGKHVLMIDDSIVRGNNSKYAGEILYTQGQAGKVSLGSCTPPIGIIGDDDIARGCEFGVDMPPTDTFIARGRSREEISKELGMEVGYLSREGMSRVFESMGMPREHLCMYCIGGKHPFIANDINILPSCR